MAVHVDQCTNVPNILLMSFKIFCFILACMNFCSYAVLRSALEALLCLSHTTMYTQIMGLFIVVAHMFGTMVPSTPI
jgi:hypothetical protein